MISSHYDADHVYGLIGCINAFDVKKVIASNYEHDSETYEKFVRAADEKGLAIEISFRGNFLRIWQRKFYDFSSRGSFCSGEQ